MLRRDDEPSWRRAAPDAVDVLALPAVPEPEVALRNRFAVPRESLRLPWQGSEVLVDVVLADRPARFAPDAFAFASGGEAGWATFPAELWRRLAQVAGFSGSLAAEAPDARALLLELMLLDLVKRIETMTGEAFRVLPDAPDPAASPFFLVLTLAFPDGGSVVCGLDLPLRLAVALAEARESAPSLAARTLDALPMTLVLSAGVQNLSVAEIAGLRPGDVVMLAEAEPTAILGSRLAAPLEPRNGGGFVLGRRFARFRPPSQQDIPSMHDAETEPETLDAVPIGLVFEIGRLEMPLADLRGLGPGSVLALEREPGEAVDIVANGRRIGRGSLVRIGEGVGVRIVRLAADG